MKYFIDNFTLNELIIKLHNLLIYLNNKNLHHNFYNFTLAYKFIKVFYFHRYYRYYTLYNIITLIF